MIKYINTSKEETLKLKHLYKCMPIEYAIKNIDENGLWVLNPVYWEDPFEKRFINGKYGKDKEIFPLKDRIFCSCFTSNSVCEAYWKIYSKDAIGIKYYIKPEEFLGEIEKWALKNPLYKVYIGKVSYTTAAEIQKGLSEIDTLPDDKKFPDEELLVRLLLLKRNAFRYEEEIRAIVISQDELQEKGFYLNFDRTPTEWIDKIMIAPDVNDYTEKMIRYYFETEYKFKSIRGKNRVVKSNLYSDNQNEAPISL